MSEWLITFLNSGWADLSFVERWLLILGTLVMLDGCRVVIRRKL